MNDIIIIINNLKSNYTNWKSILTFHDYHYVFIIIEVIVC